MPQNGTDHYEALQISKNADPDTIHRVYRLLAQRFHPDNRETGNADRFRAISEAYGILSDPAKRAQYDVAHEQFRQERWRMASNGVKPENDFEIEQLTRLMVLDALYTRRRTEPGSPGLSNLDLEELTGRPREHLEFTIWYLVQKEMVRRADNSSLTITAAGVEHLEQHQMTVQRRRLHEGEPANR